MPQLSPKGHKLSSQGLGNGATTVTKGHNLSSQLPIHGATAIEKQLQLQRHSYDKVRETT
jgi:hypothetical protein